CDRVLVRAAQRDRRRAFVLRSCRVRAARRQPGRGDDVQPRRRQRRDRLHRVHHVVGRLPDLPRQRSGQRQCVVAGRRLPALAAGRPARCLPIRRGGVPDHLRRSQSAAAATGRAQARAAAAAQQGVDRGAERGARQPQCLRLAGTLLSARARLIFNLPNPDRTFSPPVQNTALQSQPWCRFVNMNAYCWGLYRDDLYFGAAGGTVAQADAGSLDNLGAVTANAQQAWSTFANPLRKRITAVRPMVQALSAQNYSFGIGFDYGDIDIAVAATTAGTGSPWETPPWDASPGAPRSLDAPHR